MRFATISVFVFCSVSVAGCTTPWSQSEAVETPVSTPQQTAVEATAPAETATSSSSARKSSPGEEREGGGESGGGGNGGGGGGGGGGGTGGGGGGSWG